MNLSENGKAKLVEAIEAWAEENLPGRPACHVLIDANTRTANGGKA
jgi:hypothetical protein